MSNKNSIVYRRVGDYLIPNLIIPPEEARITLGRWGMMYKSYLEKHKKVLFSLLICQGKLYQHCFEVENQAKDMYDALIEKMKGSEGVTEELKEHNQWEWIQRMNNIQQRASEIVCNELIYT
ncbi:MAG: TnpV protein [Ruminococcaceae bacterium]|nr:TnpV protein [Oscillospiraceae bacterium]